MTEVTGDGFYFFKEVLSILAERTSALVRAELGPPPESRWSVTVNRPLCQTERMLCKGSVMC